MHEMALCESLIEIIEREAKAQSFGKVRAVWVEIGALSHVEPEAMRFCFSAVAHGGIAAGARFEVIGVPGEAWCMACSKSVPVAQRGDPCPECGGYQLQITVGDALRIKELEVE
ncbi:hydrogenase maturation nickel metallochaperone HypA [Rhodopseudomonas sp. HC1]|uniref:hydrogenase maturation nickel metallochaperone HypA n=1 Tax=Rhodopseudomonas infernalis TaxID=2897386 RepID=UPI001EE78EE3|nr:hydrogenase maturation nickel metallochaperone HypA [Rhodopseudomonas infernalis]MCG6207427.1 hydrogenase maturation nickel metallochaperone HypA [Rhodopseudomonas infernalis]